MRRPVRWPRFDNGFILDAAEIAGVRQRSGETLTITICLAQRCGRATRTTCNSCILVHEESGEWWVYDQQPLGDRLPTRLWYEGLADSETWNVPLPVDLVPGRYSVFTGLYRVRDRERVPVHDGEGMYWLDARVSLGSLIID